MKSERWQKTNQLFHSALKSEPRQRAETQKILDELKIQSGQRFVEQTDVAAIYTSLGEPDQAIEWLEKGYEARSGAMILLKSDPMWDGLRSDPRFQALMPKDRIPKMTCKGDGSLTGPPACSPEIDEPGFN